MPRLGPAFFDRPTLAVARDLLGARLVRRIGRGLVYGRIVEVEAYIGEDDRACHASRGRPGKKGRAAGLYVGPGHYYVYMIYGMYWCLNVVTEREGYPAAVLVRALEPTGGLHLMRRSRRAARRDRDLANGPGRLCQALAIDGRLHGKSVESRSLWLESGERVPDREVVRCPRVGVDYAGDSKDLPWRFYIRTSDCVSVRDLQDERG